MKGSAMRTLNDWQQEAQRVIFWEDAAGQTTYTIGIPSKRDSHGDPVSALETDGVANFLETVWFLPFGGRVIGVYTAE